MSVQLAVFPHEYHWKVWLLWDHRWILPVTPFLLKARHSWCVSLAFFNPHRKKTAKFLVLLLLQLDRYLQHAVTKKPFIHVLNFPSCLLNFLQNRKNWSTALELMTPWQDHRIVSFALLLFNEANQVIRWCLENVPVNRLLAILYSSSASLKSLPLGVGVMVEVQADLKFLRVPILELFSILFVNILLLYHIN